MKHVKGGRAERTSGGNMQQKQRRSKQQENVGSISSGEWQVASG